MSRDVTDEQLQALVASAKHYSLVQLHWADRYQEGADAIEHEHQRRMASLREDGTVAILSPVASDTLAGVVIMTPSVEETEQIMAGDPCVRAGMLTCRVFPCLSFPGDALP